MSRSNQLAGLITATPTSTLDTINEINASLNNDANLSTTLTNSIATKAPIASPEFTGNVGIGTTPASNQKLHVSGNTQIDGNLALVGNDKIISPANSGAGYMKVQGGGTNNGGAIEFRGGGNSGDLRFFTGTSGAGTERMRITSAGNVDIGGASHSARRFSIKGSANDNSENTIEVLNSDSTTTFKLLSNGNLEIPAGNVGIGYTSPTQMLSIKQTVNDAYTPTDYNDKSLITLNVPNAEDNYGGIRFTHAGNTEGFFGYHRESSTSDRAEFVWQGYDGSANSYKEYMRLNWQGSLKIGGIASGEQLTLDGGSGVDSGYIGWKGNGSHIGFIGGGGGLGGGANTHLVVRAQTVLDFNIGTTTYFRIEGDGTHKYKYLVSDVTASGIGSSANTDYAITNFNWNSYGATGEVVLMLYWTSGNASLGYNHRLITIIPSMSSNTASIYHSNYQSVHADTSNWYSALSHVAHHTGTGSFNARIRWNAYSNYGALQPVFKTNAMPNSAGVKMSVLKRTLL